MHDLDVAFDVGRDVKGGTEVLVHVARRKSYRAPVVDVRPIRRRRGYLVPVERSVATSDGRPGARGDGRFPGEVARIEFLESSLDVVDVEHDVRRDSVVAVGLDDGECRSMERLGRLVLACEGETEECEALAAGRKHD